MLKTFQTELQVKLAADGSYTTICLTGQGMAQDPLAELIRLTTCSPLDDNDNPIPESDVIPGATRLRCRGYFKAYNGTTLVDPPHYSVGTPILFKYYGGYTIEGTAVVARWEETGEETGTYDWSFEFLIKTITAGPTVRA